MNNQTIINRRKLVSVVIPTYNCGPYISQAIDSVLDQTYQPFEIIIIDDGSTDDTKQILGRYHDKIKYFYQKNSGGTAARNKGIKESIGEYIAFFDADDLWEKEKLAKSIEFIERNNFDWMCTALKKTTMQGEILEERMIKQGVYGYNEKTKELYDMKRGLFYLSENLPVHTNTQVMKKECFEKAGLLDESLLICENTELCIRFQDAGLRGGFLNEMLTVYRTHSSSITKSGKIDGLKYIHIVAKRYAKKSGLKKLEVRNNYSNLLWELSSIYYSRGNFVLTMKFIFLSYIYQPNLSKLKRTIKFIIKKWHFQKK